MPTTPIYGLRYPAAADPADVPTDMGELATDVETALTGVALGAWHVINDQTLSVVQASISWTALPQTYKHLVILFAARSDQVTDTSGASLRFNGDTGNNYNFQLLDATGATVSTAATAAANNIAAGAVPGGNQNVSIMGSTEIWIPNYAGTTRFKSVNVAGGYAGGAVNFIRSATGIWVSTAAINRVDLYSPTNWTVGSRFTIYGIG